MYGFILWAILNGAIWGALAAENLRKFFAFSHRTPITAAEDMAILAGVVTRNIGEELEVRRKILDICRVLEKAFKLEHVDGDAEACSFQAQAAYKIDFMLTSMIVRCMAEHRIPRPTQTERCKCGMQSWPSYMQDLQDGLRLAEATAFN